jgi:gamma-glutamyl-gamma-aminobutyrate hydrolase PuuD
MKNIAITQRLTSNPDYFEIRDSLDIQWAHLFSSLNYLPVLLPTDYDFREYFKRLRIDGLVLSGGNDLSSVSDNQLSVKRDAFEMQLIEYAIDKGIPVLGVCRGMQILADFFGGSLEKIENHAGTSHKIIVSENSKYTKQLQRLDIVNSFHNYAVTSLPDDFVISATSPESYSEAIEHKKLRIFGQMWHSERVKPFSDAELKLIKDFFGSDE